MSLDPKYGGAPRPVGALERWLYNGGRAYARLDPKVGPVRYIPGVASLPGTALPADFGRQAPPSGAARLIWSEISLAARERVTETTRWPFLLDLGGETAEAATIEAALDRLSEPLRAYLSANGVAGEPSFRLQAPLPAGCVNPKGGQLKARPCLGATKVAAGAMPVVVAVIDDGLPFAHRGLLDAAGVSTRVEYCWVQGAATDGALPYGRDLTRSEIDALRTTHGPDEDTIYARSGALDLVPGRTAALNEFGTHGSHVLLAAAGKGNDMSPSQTDLMRVIGVQLPPAVTLDTTGFGKDAFILDALDYIFLCAEEIAEAACGDRNAPLPVVVNLSYGYTGGPHDGSSPLERGMRQRIEAREQKGRPTLLVMPSGNTFLSRMHGEIPAAALNGGAPCTIPWRIQPTDLTPSYLEIWLPVAAAASSAAAFSLAISAPSGVACATAAPLALDTAPLAVAGSVLDEALSLGGRVIGRCGVEAYNERWRRVLVTLAPSDPADPALPAAPPGLWRIALRKTGGPALVAPVACRIHRDNDPYGYARGGRQSWFDDPAEELFGEDGALARIENPPGIFVRRFGTLNGIATHDKVVVVAGYEGGSDRAATYSSAGPMRSAATPPGPGDVHVSEMSDESPALPGMLGAGTRSGAVFRLSGTSVAAPQAARKLALAGAVLPAIIPQPPPPPRLSPQEAAEWPVRLGGRL